MQPAELQRLLAAGEALALLDVREADEVAICRIPGAVHIPMNEVPQRLGELDAKAKTVVYCHHGMRSLAVAGFLLQQGFADVTNLTGGIDLWAALVDPSLSRY